MKSGKWHEIHPKCKENGRFPRKTKVTYVFLKVTYVDGRVVRRPSGSSKSPLQKKTRATARCVNIRSVSDHVDAGGVSIETRLR